MKEAEVIYTDQPTVACSGEGVGGIPGHPLIYLAFKDTNRIVCPYCSKTYALQMGSSSTRH